MSRLLRRLGRSMSGVLVGVLTIALLGAAQVVLGERDSDPAWLNAALNSYQAASTVYTREAAPNDWARMQRNSGAVLSLQGERTGDTASLRQAVDLCDV